MNLLTCTDIEVGKSWCALFNGMVNSVFYAYGWDSITDLTASADIFICFDGVQSRSGQIKATWLSCYKGFFNPQQLWPTYVGRLIDGQGDPIVCNGIMIKVVSAAKNNSLSCQFLGV